MIVLPVGTRVRLSTGELATVASRPGYLIDDDEDLADDDEPASYIHIDGTHEDEVIGMLDSELTVLDPNSSI